jgi:C4-dicarboxylate-specific signal transduction histidine kinase
MWSGNERCYSFDPIRRNRSIAILIVMSRGVMPIPIVVDRVLLQQVILNLIMNAMEAMREAGTRARILRIRTEQQHSGSIVIPLRIPVWAWTPNI